ncbi:DUF4304 domain-containing protein [Corallincola spongiicola]|uniref:DUF4304 domain-containing protein n=1 Tax=Corallincola spongiicola TaxID=2520508 RepID=A0ABY1WQX9_9GAMM|nr:DUF4304 domain-containing protein [Corallincola spongiicola]TAA47126.1 DUF4304 domain-containing protein [Corallincola spongiicola]
MSAKISKMRQDSLKPAFKSEGFKKKGAAWGLVTDEMGKLFKIQCSQNSDRIYFNIGIYLQALGKVEFPREVDCHVRCRLEQFLASKEDILSFYELTDFENCPDPQERVKEISKLVTSKVMPWFRKLNSPSDIVALQEVAPTMFWNNGKELLEKLSEKHT